MDGWIILYLLKYSWLIMYFSCMAKWFSYVYINISVLFQIIFPYRLLQNIGYGSLCYVVGPCLVMGSRSLLQGMFTSSRDLCNPGIEPRSPALQVDSLPSELLGKPKNTRMGCHAVLQGVFLTLGANSHLSYLLHWQAGSLPLSPPQATFFQRVCCCC